MNAQLRVLKIKKKKKKLQKKKKIKIKKRLIYVIAYLIFLKILLRYFFKERG